MLGDESNTKKKEFYIFPKNYSDNGLVLGFIHKKSIFTLVAWVVPLELINFLLLPFNDYVKLPLMVLILAPSPFIIMGCNEEPLIDYLRYAIKYFKNSKVYLYDK